jgi:hypothetical protein
MTGLALLVLVYGVGCVSVGLGVGLLIGMQRMAWRRVRRAE